MTEQSITVLQDPVDDVRVLEPCVLTKNCVKLLHCTAVVGSVQEESEPLGDADPVGIGELLTPVTVGEPLFCVFDGLLPPVSVGSCPS